MDNVDKYVQDQLNEIDKEVNRDQDIRDRAAYIYEQFKLHPVYRDNFKGIDYELAMKQRGNKIMLMASNVSKRKIMGNKYFPYTFSADYDPEIPLEETYKTIIATFIAHVSGRLAIETEEGTEYI